MSGKNQFDWVQMSTLHSTKIFLFMMKEVGICILALMDIVRLVEWMYLGYD